MKTSVAIVAVLATVSQALPFGGFHLGFGTGASTPILGLGANGATDASLNKTITSITQAAGGLTQSVEAQLKNITAQVQAQVNQTKATVGANTGASSSSSGGFLSFLQGLTSHGVGADVAAKLNTTLSTSLLQGATAGNLPNISAIIPGLNANTAVGAGSLAGLTTGATVNPTTITSSITTAINNIKSQLSKLFGGTKIGASTGFGTGFGI